MTLTVTQEEFNLLRELIRKECGIVMEDSKTYLIESRLTKLVIETGCSSFGEFYLKAQGMNAGLREKIVDAITTNETLWFRDESPFITLNDCIFPELFQAVHEGKKDQIRFWSAACSTGQEPYSIAMSADRFATTKGYQAELEKMTILATDISPSALMLAKLARYDQLSMSRGMKDEYREQYFTQQGNVCVLNDAIKKRVTLQKFNVQHSFQPLGKFDVIFLRNIAIYFSEEFKNELLDKVADALLPGGYLFLGASESFPGFRTHFEQRQHGRCYYYQKKP